MSTGSTGMSPAMRISISGLIPISTGLITRPSKGATRGDISSVNKSLILEHLRKNGSVGAPLKEIQKVLPNHNRGQLQVLLRELRDEEKIRLEGKTNAARWFIRED